MRKFWIPLILLVVIGGFFGWRAMHPKLTDEQQIAANLGAICDAANARNPRGIADFLAKDFQTGGTGKKGFRESLTAGILQFRVVDLSVSGVKTSVLRAALGEGVTAASSGNFLLSLKSEFNSPAQKQSGKFDLTWRKIEGEWQIVAADVPDLAQFGN